MTKERFEEYIKPFVVLVAICLVVAFLLAFTNDKTAPVIAENAAIEAEQTRQQVMSGATGFEEVDCDVQALGIDSAFRETSGLGYVISATSKGYGGDVTVTVGIDNDGNIVGMQANVSSETTGIGSKAGERAYIENFIGRSGNVDDVDTITNATYSSTAVKTCVNAALGAFEQIREGN